MVYPWLYHVYPTDWMYMVYSWIYHVYPPSMYMVYPWIYMVYHLMYILGIYVLYCGISMDIHSFLKPDFDAGPCCWSHSMRTRVWVIKSVSCHGDTMAIVPGEKAAHKRLTTSSSSSPPLPLPLHAFAAAGPDVSSASLPSLSLSRRRCRCHSRRRRRRCRCRRCRCRQHWRQRRRRRRWLLSWLRCVRQFLT
jgi:hypothetical protein